MQTQTRTIETVLLIVVLLLTALVLYSKLPVMVKPVATVDVRKVTL